MGGGSAANHGALAACKPLGNSVTVLVPFALEPSWAWAKEVVEIC